MMFKARNSKQLVMGIDSALNEWIEAIPEHREHLFVNLLSIPTVFTSALGPT
jgi:hypothetical protein